MNTYPTNEITRDQALKMLSDHCFKKMRLSEARSIDIEDMVNELSQDGENEDIFGIMKEYKVIN